ncbi:helix-turn-helix domain-containing protein [Cohnella cellulosilytica]|uniref:Helix-turn-helix domain-containing protein n=1 Tax=Cohnella cellulosilytica TaxID=986710 RepID=A0ABW2FML7_9BACL
MGVSKRLGQKTLFVHLMIPYFLFMLLALFLGWLFYNQTYDVVKSEVMRNNMHLLEQVKETMDSRMSEMNMIAMQLSSNPRVQSFQRVSDPFNDTTTYKVLETQKNLYSYSASNNFVLDYYLLFKNSDLALSTNTTYELPAFYEHVLSYENMDYATWREELFDTYRNREIMQTGAASYQGRSYEMLTYVQSLGYPGHVQGALIVLVDAQNLKSLLSGVDVSDGGWAAIVDEKGRLVSSLSSDGGVPEVDGDDYPGKSGMIEPSAETGDRMLTYMKSEYNGWSYVVAQPPHIVLGKVFTLKQLTLTILLVFVAIGFVLAYLFANRSGKPLARIVSMLKERHVSAQPQRPKDMYGFIQHSLNHLIHDNDELQREIERQSPLLWETFFQRLLKGEFMTMNEINTLLQHQRIEINGIGYAVGIVHFPVPGGERGADALTKLDIERVLIKEALGGYLGDAKYVHNLAEDKLALLFVDYVGDEAQFRQRTQRGLTAITEGLAARVQSKLLFAVGGFRSSLLDVSGSYEEARQSLCALRDEEDAKIVWYADLPNEQAGFYFPADAESRLINYTKAGETSEVRQLLESLYRENFQRRHLPLAMQQLFFFEVVSCLVKLQDELLPRTPLDIKQLFQQFAAGESPHLAYRSVSERFLEASEEADGRKKSRNVKLIDDILAYVNEHFGEAALNLDAVADRMNISKGYMSQFFKEQTGINFSDYLEKRRMDEAKRLLGDTSLPIGYIAERVGYQSSSTFCRAFKRSGGLSATSYREFTQGNMAVSSAEG